MLNLLNIISGGCFYDPYAGFEIIGFFLVILMVVLIVRQRRKSAKNVAVDENSDSSTNIYVEKDVLGFDRTYINYSEPNYKTANKSKLQMILFLMLFVLGLLFFIIGVSNKDYHSDDITTPSDVQFNPVKETIHN